MRLISFSLSALVLSVTMVASVNGAEAEQNMFLFSLSPSQGGELALDPTEPALVIEAESPALPVELNYDAPCDIKCGVSTTGLVLLHMYVESKEDQEYRYTLINPNYEP